MADVFDRRGPSTELMCFQQLTAELPRWATSGFSTSGLAILSPPMTHVDDRIKQLEEQVRQLKARLSTLTEELQALRAKAENTIKPADGRS